MNQKIIGFIGGGNMGSAIIGGLLKSGLSDKDHIIAADKTKEAADRLKSSFGIQTSTENIEISSLADILFLSVKPNMFATVIPQIRHHLKPDAVVVSIAAGQSLKKIEDLFEHPVKLIRAMPNTCLLYTSAKQLILWENIGVPDCFFMFGSLFFIYEITDHHIQHTAPAAQTAQRRKNLVISLGIHPVVTVHHLEI